MPIVELEAVADAYVDEAAPDSNFGTDVELHVRSDDGANKRAFFEFDMDQLPADFAGFDFGWREINEIVVQVVDDSSSQRTILLDEADGAFGEGTLTWNNQPGSAKALGHDESNPDGLVFDLLSVAAFGGVPTSGPFRLLLKDETEDEGLLPAEQRLASREHGTLAPPTYRISYYAARQVDLASSLVVRRSATGDLASHVLPRVPAERDLAAALEVVFVEDLVATVTPSLTPLEARARVQGVVTRLFLKPLEDFQRISDEAGSVVTRVQDAETVELRRIVQVVASGTPAFSLSETPTFPGTDTGTPDTLRRGDAILFALGGDRWDPGARVTVEDAEFVVAGVLGTERVEDQMLYQEIGLRRLSVTTQGRAAGVVG